MSYINSYFPNGTCGLFSENCSNVTWLQVWSATLGSMVYRMALAGLAGAIVGAQREFGYILNRWILSGPWSSREKPSSRAGLRTHMLVSFASALFTIVSQHGFMRATPFVVWVNPGDASRVAAQVVSGISFLGSATVWRSSAPGKIGIHGLTTGASIWTCAAIGMTCASQFECEKHAPSPAGVRCFGGEQLAFIAAFITVVALQFIGLFEEWLHGRFETISAIAVHGDVEFFIQARLVDNYVPHLINILHDSGLRVLSYSMSLTMVTDDGAAEDEGEGTDAESVPSTIGPGAGGRWYKLREPGTMQSLVSEKSPQPPTPTPEGALAKLPAALFEDSSSTPGGDTLAGAPAFTAGTVRRAPSAQSLLLSGHRAVALVHLGVDFEVDENADSFAFVEICGANIVHFKSASVTDNKALPQVHKRYVRWVQRRRLELNKENSGVL